MSVEPAIEKEMGLNSVKIFVSHSSKYSDIAKSLKRSLQALETTTLLDIRISEEMVGSSDWRRWIDENVRSADVFLLLYPHASMEMGWCNYELGRFYEHERHVVCIKNTDIPVPPPAFEPYQAYNADQAGFLKFLKELFVSGAFTRGQALNPAVGSVTDPHHERAQSVAAEMAKKFAEARVRQQLYESNIAIAVRYNSAKQFDRVASTIEGNAEGLRLLGLDKEANARWSDVRQSLGANVDWPAELENALLTLTNGSLPPALAPFRASTVMYIPVITKSESVDGVLRKVDLIFVEASPDRLRALLDWSLPLGMPDAIAYLIRLFRMMFRLRWEILQPRYQEATYRAPSRERCVELAQSVIAECDQVRTFAEHEGMQGLDKFYSAFSKDLRAEVNACTEEWMEVFERLRTEPADNPQGLSRQLKGLLINNAKWLNITARQFASAIVDLLEDAKSASS